MISRHPSPSTKSLVYVVSTASLALPLALTFPACAPSHGPEDQAQRANLSPVAPLADAGAKAEGPTGTRLNAAGPMPSAAGPKPVLQSSFAFLGCNRLDKADWNAASNPSSANVAQVQQTFSDIAGLSTAPSFLFFTGDLVLGMNKDTSVLRSQLDAWANLFKSDASGIAKKTTLIPITGNHEVLFKSNGAEFSNGPANPAWVSWIGANGWDTFAGNGPTAASPNADALTDDQSRLSYSFTKDGIHYIALNTDTLTSTPDPSTKATQVGWIAMNWLQNDVQAAQNDSSVSSIFVFGHKPIVAPNGGTTGDDAINPAFTSQIESLFDQSTKVRGYFCAHAHMWDARKLPGARGVYQVTAGNGGSPLEAEWAKEPNPYYGFSVARIYASGAVGIVSYQRAVPTPYNAASAAPATPATELMISP